MTCTDASHAAIVASDEMWSELVMLNTWQLGDQLHELANCPHCGSTLSRVITAVTAVTLDDDQVEDLAIDGEISDYEEGVARGILTPRGHDTTAAIRRRIAALWNAKHGLVFP